MWQPQGVLISSDRFGEIEPLSILYEFDGPRIFTFRDSLGELLLAYLCAEDDSASRYVVVPIDDFRVDELVQGRKSMREALDQPWTWLVDVPFGQLPHLAWRMNTADLPSWVLPKQGLIIV